MGGVVGSNCVRCMLNNPIMIDSVTQRIRHLAARLNTKACVALLGTGGSYGVCSGAPLNRKERCRRSETGTCSCSTSQYCERGGCAIFYLSQPSSMAGLLLQLTCLVFLSLVTDSSQIQWLTFLFGREKTTPAPAVTSPAPSTAAPEENTVPILPTSSPPPTGASRAKKLLRMYKGGECGIGDRTDAGAHAYMSIFIDCKCIYSPWDLFGLMKRQEGFALLCIRSVLVGVGLSKCHCAVGSLLR